jgi:hypothetical protein
MARSLNIRLGRPALVIAAALAAAAGGAVVYSEGSGGACEFPSCFPDATNTGVLSGSLTPFSGLYEADTPDEVIEGLDVTGEIYVTATNVTIRDTRVTADGGPGITGDSTGLLIEDVTVDGNGDNSDCIQGGGMVVRRVDLSNCENGFDIQNGPLLVEDSYVHDLDDVGTDVHADGAQFNPGVSDVTFDHNTMDLSPDSTWTTTGVINIYNDSGTQDSDITINENLLDGQSGTVAIYCPRFSGWSDIVITDNRLEPGVSGYSDSCENTTTWSGNVDDSSGATVDTGE